MFKNRTLMCPKTGADPGFLEGGGPGYSQKGRAVGKKRTIFESLWLWWFSQSEHSDIPHRKYVTLI